jgi:hypothetical protein
MAIESIPFFDFQSAAATNGARVVIFYGESTQKNKSSPAPLFASLPVQQMKGIERGAPIHVPLILAVRAIKAAILDPAEILAILCVDPAVRLDPSGELAVLAKEPAVLDTPKKLPVLAVNLISKTNAAHQRHHHTGDQNYFFHFLFLQLV